MPVVYTCDERKQLALARGILVDPEDMWMLGVLTWHVTSGGYAAARVPKWRTHVYLHHMIMGCPIRDREEIDHINRCPSDNRRSNLRWVTHSQNLTNNAQATGVVGIRGVTLNASGNYIAQVKRKGVNHYLGSYATVDAAVTARDRWLETQHEVCNE
jgi:hypothetical protein